jgi:hypothetical protein
VKDNAVNIQALFKKAVSKYGIPKKLFSDNGETYKNDQLHFTNSLNSNLYKVICLTLSTVTVLEFYKSLAHSLYK